MQKNTDIIESAVGKVDFEAGRRAFLRTSGLMAAGAAVLGVTGVPGTAQAASDSDNVVLNFALNLEYLEAEFYLRAAFGRGLDETKDVDGAGKKGSVTVPSGQPVSDYPSNLSPTILNYAKEIAHDEETHVRTLRTGLGSAKVARPAINLNTSFTAAAIAAGLITEGQTFNPFANDNNFLLGAFIFEDVGVTAYKGAARLLSNSTVLTMAAGLLAVEAYHAGAVRTLLVSKGLFSQAQAISDARDSLDKREGDPTNDDRDQGIGTASQFNIVPTNDIGLAFSRDPQQVLKIVYLGNTAGPSSFFPKKLNGAVA